MMNLHLNAAPNAGAMLSPTGLAAANDLIDLGLEPIVNIDDDDVANAVRATSTAFVSSSLTSRALPLLLSSIPHSQMLQPKKKKARNSINGDPQWEMMDAPAVIGEELTMKLCGLANVVGEDDLTALGAAKNAGFAAHIDSCAEDGGGWSLQGGDRGRIHEVSFICRCRIRRCEKFVICAGSNLGGK